MPDESVSGPGLQKLVGCLPEGIRVVSDELWQPQALAVGQLAHLHYAAGRRDDLWKLAPLYFRPSAAEEKATGIVS